MKKREFYWLKDRVGDLEKQVKDLERGARVLVRHGVYTGGDYISVVEAFGSLQRFLNIEYEFGKSTPPQFIKKGKHETKRHKKPKTDKSPR